MRSGNASFLVRTGLVVETDLQDLLAMHVTEFAKGLSIHSISRKFTIPATLVQYSVTHNVNANRVLRLLGTLRSFLPGISWSYKIIDRIYK